MESGDTVCNSAMKMTRQKYTLENLGKNFELRQHLKL